MIYESNFPNESIKLWSYLRLVYLKTSTVTIISNAVPDVNAPKVSERAASIPIANPPIIVRGSMYLFKIDSKILWSFLNPGICKPEAIIFLAWLYSSIPEVLTQRTANNAEKHI